ncbi:MAG: hypothetical protein BA871_07455 [Desulfuromonadales bacterium C00003096]|nr:MAG: hypothetical protein BA871_07455 [Desulfuromonadales bacterium C00003096]
MENNTASNLFTLRFCDRELEAEFQQDSFARNVKRTRLTCVVGAFMYAIFYLMDQVVIPDLKTQCLLIRFAIVCPAILLSLLATYTKCHYRLRNIFILICGSLSSLGIIYMIAHASSPGNHIYYGGLVLCVLFYYLFIPEWIVSNIVSWLTFIIFEVVVVFFVEVPWEYRFGNSFIFFFFNLSGMFACYMLENSERLAFLQRRTIERQAKELRVALDLAKGEWRQAESLARLDSLTGLANRRHFFNLADRELSCSDRHPQCLSLLMIDIDHFKQFNDRYGHQIGDLVLQRVADTIKRTIRKPDTACRYGGEEFVVLLPETDLVAAEKLAQRLLEAIAETTVAHNQELLGITASLGVGALRNDETTDVATLIERADQALYAAKNSGRNQLRVWRKPVNDNTPEVNSAAPPVSAG